MHVLQSALVLLQPLEGSNHDFQCWNFRLFPQLQSVWIFFIRVLNGEHGEKLRLCVKK